MSINELLDEEGIDPKKLFDEKQYSTLVIDREGFSKAENDIADLIELLLQPTINREQSEEVFSSLKAKNAQEMLVQSIEAAETNEEKAKLIAACWECGLDFNKYYLVFTTLACHSDFMIALEAFTVIENAEHYPAQEVLAQALSIVNNTNSKHTSIINDLKVHLQNGFQE
ncbi:MAG: hypothetical protein QM534_16785 [Sediminibacterium sp.]|nr:hypothetical protein [Sediminibacterium sp.]